VIVTFLLLRFGSAGVSWVAKRVECARLLALWPATGDGVRPVWLDELVWVEIGALLQVQDRPPDGQAILILDRAPTIAEVMAE
jgi:hypothetical protein